ADSKYVVSVHGLSLKSQALSQTPSLRLWDLARGRETLRISPALAKGECRAAVISPDRKTLAVAVSDTVVLWELATGEERGRFSGHKEWIWSLAFSADGCLLASGSHDYTALVWDMTGISPNGKLPVRNIELEELKRLWTDLGGA